MPHRCLVIEAPKSTPLRRSPRLLQLDNIPPTQNPCSRVHPISVSSPTSLPKFRSKSKKNPQGGFPRNLSNESKSGPRTCEKSARSASRFGTDLDSNVPYFLRNKSQGDCPGKSSKSVKDPDGGSMNNGKSANKSTIKSVLRENFEGLKALRRSPRFCNKVNSLVATDNRDMHNLKASTVTLFGTGEKKSRLSMSESQKRIEVQTSRRSPRFCNKVNSLVATDNRDMHNLEASPVTPFGMGEKKSRLSMSESQKRIEVQPSRMQGKKGENDSFAVIVCGLASSSVSVSLCRTPGGLHGREQKLKANHPNKCKSSYSCEPVVNNSKRMITRSASKRKGGLGDMCRELIMERQNACTSARIGARKASSTMTMKEKQEGCGSLTPLICQPQKRITRRLVAHSSINPEEVYSDVRPLSSYRGEVENKTQAISKDTKLVGNKRKRKQEGLLRQEQGWTKEQEVALQRAYFTAKPSPHFWKRVAKLVPGRSSQECFDKVHSDNLTPLSTRPTRAKKWKSPSDSSLSGCNLFKSVETKSKKTRRTKQKSHVARRRVRHLLQMYCQVNEDDEADLFSVLEPTVNPSAEVLQLNAVHSTPEQFLGSPGSSSKHCNRPSGPKKCLSRIGSASKIPLTSPPVLKKVKNMAQHEKYIDQLHKREAKRKVKSAGHATLVPCQKDEGENPVAMKDVIRAAKDALVSDARDAIDKFRHSQLNIMHTFSDSEEEVLTNEDEDDGIVT